MRFFLYLFFPSLKLRQMKSLILPARPIAGELEGVIQPKANGHRLLIDQQERLVMNRHGEIKKEANEVWSKIEGLGIKTRYIDAELMVRTQTGRGSIILIDAFDPQNPKPIQERLKEIEEVQIAPFALQPGKVYRMPTFDIKNIKALWWEMDRHNRNGEVLWEGFVSKNDKAYPWIKKPSWCSVEWHKWRLR